MKFIVIVSGTIGGVVGTLVGVAAVRALLGNGRSDAAVDKVLVQTASEINQNLPMMVDRFTRLDATGALPGKRLLYRYSVIGMDITEEGILSQLRPKAVNNYKTSTDMAELRRMGVILVYTYVDEAGNEIGRFEIKPGEFQ